MANVKEPYYLVKVVDKKWAEKLMDGEVFMRAIACFGDLSNRSKDSNNQFRGILSKVFLFLLRIIIILMHISKI